MVKFTILLRRKPSTIRPAEAQFLDLHACEFVLSTESVFVG